MGLIKAANTPASLQPFSMKDIENQAKTILLRAQQRAEQLLAESQRVAEELKQQARAEGLAQGRQEGLAKGMEEGRKAGQQQALAEHRARLGELAGALVTAMAELDGARQQLEAEALREVVELAVSIARRVTKRQGAVDPGVLEANVAAAMKLVVQACDVRIAIHPTQKQALAQVLPQLQMHFPQLKHVELLEEPGLAPGGCRIFTGRGQIDADLDGQLDRVVADLMPLREEPGA